MTPGPTSPVVTNQSMVLFSTAAGTDSIAFSNTVRTPVVGPLLEAVKSADRAQAVLGETLAFTVELVNRGVTDASVTLYDPPPEGTSFVPNSVVAGGAPVAGADPGAGVPLGTLRAGQRIRVSFQVSVVSIPPSLSLVNRARAVYRFEAAGGRTVEGSVQSGPVTIRLQAFSLTAALTVNTPVTFPGDTVTYTLVIRNDGLQPVRQLGAVIRLPQGVTFAPGSAVVNGVIDPSADPVSGITLGTLAGRGGGIGLSFQAVVGAGAADRLEATAAVTYEAGTPLVTDAAVLNIVRPQPELRKAVDKRAAAPGDELQYTLTAVNPGSLAVEAVLRDPPPAGLLPVWNSVVLNGTPLPGADPAAGIPLGVLQPGGTATAIFRYAVPASASGRELGIVRNAGTLTYTYQLPDGRRVRQTAASAETVTGIWAPELILAGLIVPPVAEPGETLTAAVSVTNRGNYPADTVLDLLIPPGTVLDAGSLRIGAGTDPALVTISSYPGTPAEDRLQVNNTLPLGVLEPGASVTVTYALLVVLHPPSTVLSGTWRLAYTFALEGRTYTGEVYSNLSAVRLEEADE